MAKRWFILTMERNQWLFICLWRNLREPLQRLWQRLNHRKFPMGCSANKMRKYSQRINWLCCACGCRGAPCSPCRRFTLTMKRSVFHSLVGEKSWELFEGRGYYTLHLPCSFHGLLVPGKIGYFLQLIDEFSNCGIWWEWYWKHMWQANSVKKKLSCGSRISTITQIRNEDHSRRLYCEVMKIRFWIEIMSFATICIDTQFQFLSKVGKQKYSSSCEIERWLILYSDLSQFFTFLLVNVQLVA